MTELNRIYCKCGKEKDDKDNEVIIKFIIKLQT